VAIGWKVVMDAADPNAQAAFWASALEYVVEDNSAIVSRLVAAGALPPAAVTEVAGRPAFADLAAVRHPDDPVDPATGGGLGRRVMFQRVAEPKAVKNRVHLDLHVGPDARAAHVERLTTLGATVLREVAEPGGRWTTMADPEGNEFCIERSLAERSA
jgi:Glyoxalase-like domain